MVVTDENPPEGIDVTRPSIARVYDYWLGGCFLYTASALGIRLKQWP